MSKKRAPGSYLTQDNCEEEDEMEEAGVFKSASEDVLQKRTIIKARRKHQGDSEQPTKNTFAGFSFGSISSSSDTAFKFPTSNPNSKTDSSSEQKIKSLESESKTNGSSASDSSATSSGSKETEATKSEAKISFGSTASSEVMFKIPEPSASASISSKDEDPDKGYARQMRNLNESFFKWVSECISKNPECILTPCFEDYTKYAKKFDKMYPCVVSGSQKKSSTDTPALFANPDDKDDEPQFSSQADESKKNVALAFSFGSKEQSVSRAPAFGSLVDKSLTSAANQEGPSKNEGPPVMFSCLTTSPSAFPSKFSFNTGSAATFSFGTGSAFPTFGQGFLSKPSEVKVGEGASDQTAAGGEDDDYEPPKAEVVKNDEEGAFFTTRCKLYYKKDHKFEERGVGFLYLKPNGKKTQLLVRTDTALGNILLNINLEKVMPVSRHGKNNIAVICFPNPPIDPKGDSKLVIMLIKVGTEEYADKLYKEITDCQAKM